MLRTRKGTRRKEAISDARKRASSGLKSGSGRGPSKTRAASAGTHYIAMAGWIIKK